MISNACPTTPMGASGGMFWIALLMSLSQFSASPTMAGMRAGAAGGCEYELTGELTDGDAAKLRVLAAPHNGEFERALCLNSSGGSFSEALKIAEFIMVDEPYIRTVVGPGHECYSACALVFLAGARRNTSERVPDRWLHVTAKLGFHAPYIEPSQFRQRQMSGEDLAAAYDAAMQSSQRLLALLGRQTYQRYRASPDPWVSPGLIQRFLKKSRNEFYVIDTVGKASAFNIALYGTNPPNVFSAGDLENACENQRLRQQEAFLDEVGKDGWAKERLNPTATVSGSGNFDLILHDTVRPRCAFAFSDRKNTSTFGSLVARYNDENPVTGVEFSDFYPWSPSSRLIDLPVHSRLSAPAKQWGMDGPQKLFRIDANLASILSRARTAERAVNELERGLDGQRQIGRLTGPGGLQNYASPSPSTDHGLVSNGIGFSAITNHHLSGADLSILKDSTQQTCASRCGSSPACLGYTYDNWNKWCFLKGDLGEITFDPKYSSGYKASTGEPRRPVVPTSIMRYRGKAFPPAAGEMRHAPNVTACEAMCTSVPACVAYTWSRSTKVCRLLESAGEYQSNSDTDSGVKRQVVNR